MKRITRKCLNRAWNRLRFADAVDWLFGALFLVVGLAVGTIVYAHVASPTESWGAISYVVPAPVQDAEGLPTRQTDDGSIYMDLTRLVDCATFECPSGSIPVAYEISLARLGPAGQTVQMVEIDDGIAQVDEGSVYTVGKLRAVTVNFEVVIPPAALNLPGTEWRIQGSSTPLVPGGVTAPWSSDTFYIEEE